MSNTSIIIPELGDLPKGKILEITAGPSEFWLNHLANLKIPPTLAEHFAHFTDAHGRQYKVQVITVKKAPGNRLSIKAIMAHNGKEVLCKMDYNAALCLSGHRPLGTFWPI